jgi:hypothetical protein
MATRSPQEVGIAQYGYGMLEQESAVKSWLVTLVGLETSFIRLKGIRLHQPDMTR